MAIRYYYHDIIYKHLFERKYMDDKSLEILEFLKIREILTGYTSFSASRDLAEALTPRQDYEQITLLLKQTAEARQLLNLDRGFAIGSVLDIREKAKLAAREGTLDTESLLEVQQTLAALHEVCRYFQEISGDFPLIWEIVGGIVELKQIEKDIGSCIDPAGEVLDTASPDLVNIRQQLRETRGQIQERLETILKSPRGQRILQEDVITEREGRYVILVKTECRHEIKGIVHDISNTGATVFMEPTVTVGLGNAMRELVIEERREIERILRLLSAEVGASCEEIMQNIALAAELDLILAKARYARKIKAVEPIITESASDSETDARTGNGILRLIDARHPLLGDKAVPFSLEIGRDFSILVITGPNTGGKTVTLKTLGLLSLMAQAGMPIPAAGESQIPLFDGIYADIGDEQSIEQTLSSFSWHISNVIRVIKGATGKSLVLLDELGTSTDPAEGSALARAIMRYFLTRGTLAVATTHYSDLKAFAYSTEGMENASLEFDPVTLTPTYRLTVGLPGGSNAMATAARLGIPEEIINDARGMLSQGSQELEGLLRNLMTEKELVVSLKRELETEREEYKRRNAELKVELQRLKDEESKAIREARDAIVRETAELNRQIRQAAAELRKEKTGAAIEQARRTLAEVREKLDSEAWQPKTGELVETDSEVIKVGDTVRVKEVGLTATVLAISEESREIEVQSGRTKMRMGLDNVVKITPAETTAPLTGTQPEVRRAPLELDLRGRRADEVEPALDAYLNDAAQSNLNEVRIIHGIGTGTVRNIVRELLTRHPLAKSFRAGEHDEGGDGVTMVRI
jgi:DNA mismatch repair protein MutS2